MTSCVGFNLAGFDVCDGWECWTGWDDEGPCVGSVIICLVFCDDFSTLVGFDDDSVMESLDVDCF